MSGVSRHDAAAAFGHPAWVALTRSSLTLLQQARFGHWSLPPDWLLVENGQVSLAPDQPPQYGFNAVWVPLNLVWGGQTDAALLAPFRAFWSAPRDGAVPAWVGLSGEAAALQGEDVKDNTRVSARLDLSYDLKPDGFDHLRVGPFASYARFDHNLSHYTWGHGGYYSPSQDLRQGLALDALTTEGQRWQVEARASVALAQAEEDAAPRFWLGDDAGGQYDASRTDGVNGQVSLRASTLLGDHLILSGFSRYQAAPQYTDVAIGAFLTIPFSARGGVFSADLPDSVFTPFR